MKQIIPLLFLLIPFSSVFVQPSQRAWVSDDSTANQPGVCNIRRAVASRHKTGARSCAVSRMDAPGDLWWFNLPFHQD